MGVNRRRNRRQPRRSERRISVRAVRRDPIDLRKLSRALLALAQAEVEAEAEARQRDERQEASEEPNSERP
jgi:hypothetical protein